MKVELLAMPIILTYFRVNILFYNVSNLYKSPEDLSTKKRYSGE